MENIKSIREENNLKQSDIAKLLGINRTTYTSYETQRDTIPIYHLNSICNYFNISIDYAMGLNNIRSYPNSRKEINTSLLKTRLRELRKNNKLTQKDIANILNISRSTWTGYEYGKFRISTLILYELAKRYHSSMDYILGKIDKL